jgi:glyceraldehyde 3-phosphate dehydrogenase
MKRITINWFGGIGSATLKLIIETPGLEIVAINDIIRMEDVS